MVTLVVHYLAKPDTADDVAAGLRELVEAARAEPGCVRFEATRSVDDPNRFLLFEQYVDEAALEAHSTSEHFTRIVLGRLVPQLEHRVRERYVEHA